MGVLFAAASIPLIHAQKFSFEENALPDGWTMSDGKAEINSVYSTDGKQSLIIEVAPGKKGVLKCNITSIQPTASLWFKMDVLNLVPTTSGMTVSFLSEDGTPQLTGEAMLKFSGWMPYYRKYNGDYKAAASKASTVMQVSIDNTEGKEAVRICLDNLDFAASISSPNALPIMAKDVALLKSQATELLRLHATQVLKTDLPATAEEKSAIEALRAAHPLTPDATGADIEAARKFAGSLNVERDQNKEITRCNPVATTFNKTNEEVMLKQLNALAASTTESDKQLFNDYLDAVLFTNILYRYPQLAWNTYAEVRSLPRLMLCLIPVCSDSQKTKLLDCVRWITEAGWGDVDMDYFRFNFNSDIMYLTGGSNYHISSAVYNPDVNRAASDLRTLRSMLENIVAPVSGGYEIVKPDGCGYHHGAHYNNYMYAFNPWITTALKLSTTPFYISETAYGNAKKAVLSMFEMANRSNTGSTWFAKSLAGRHPHSGGQLNQMNGGSLDNLIGVSKKYFGGNPDEELAAAYNYFLLSDKYQVKAKNFSGFYQFNYSPMGIYRNDDWVVTMRCPNTEAWGAEIYSAKNRYGRYQSTGSMEVLYNGDLKNSGVPSVTTGYDWNVVPGTTTVHYNSWKEMMPSQNTSRRFDQKSKTKDFSGALAWNLKSAGVFSCDYDQNDTHTISGTKCYSTSTNLMFKKTIFAIDGMLFNMGSNISANGVYNVNWITATNLFQEVGDDLTDFQVNGRTIGRDTSKEAFSVENDNLWLVTPKGTGYIVPKGNKDVIVSYGEQAGPNETGSTATSPETGIGAKAYITHGKKPTNDSYSFIMVPGVKNADLATKTSEIVEKFEIIAQNDKCHGILYKPDMITALSFFDATPSADLELVKATGSSMIVMYQKQSDGKLALALCDPNLHVNRITTDLHNWSVSPSQTWLRIAGDWEIASSANGISATSAGNNMTEIALNLADGLPEYIMLTPKSNLAVKEIIGTGLNATARIIGNMVEVGLRSAAEHDVKVEAFDVNGLKVGESTISVGTDTCSVNLLTDSAVVIVKISDANNSKIFKLGR